MRRLSRKQLIWSLVGIVVLGGLVWGVRWATFARPPLPEAVAALASDELVTVDTARPLTFTPAHVPPTTGFIFYPGGRVDPRAYAGLMRTIAQAGYLVVVPSMPVNMAIFNTNAANAIIAAHPQIQRWVIGGHSVGGTAAALYVSAHPDRIAGLAIWSSFPAGNSDISELDLPVILLYGGNETGVTDQSVGARKHLLPPDTLYIRIEGGDHHQFGAYALTTEDDLATIAREVQHDRILTATLELLQRVSSSP
ncbi:MAG: alpha/beta hydrolase [Spirochaetaceae bacterium]|nr:MAG: alpha/beta hydrolase [Spirochaetaceae bacterium]